MQLEVSRRNGEIYSHVRKTWLIETPEERVRQEYLCVLVNNYGYVIDQIEEEVSVTGRGSGQARADFLIWRSVQEKQASKTPLIVIECKAENVDIDASTYTQGANYAQYARSKFFVTHNNNDTKYWQVDLTRRMPNYFEIENIPDADATDAQIEEIFTKLKIFKEDEFANLLQQCHDVIRSREKKDPIAAFDEIAKILFIKVHFERRMRESKVKENLFTVEQLDREGRLHSNPIESLFNATKEAYSADHIFGTDEGINLKTSTVKEIVRLLERYNLSDTSEDIKGIAFEKFLSKTFRGDIGQFFTPRCIVEFMIRMVDPKEGDRICDPASGSGGFLIRFFEIVRQRILEDIDREYQDFQAELIQKNHPEEKTAKLLNDKFNTLQQSVDQKIEGSRLWKLANRYIFGCDANERMSRTSKMNMIMHGDGHGGVHHHDGLINTNGIFDNSFDLVLTNPPFGASVDSSEIISDADVISNDSQRDLYLSEFKDHYINAMNKTKAMIGKPLTEFFDLAQTKVTKTEILFIERCINLLKPGGRLGIVLPEGVLNGPSLEGVRRYVENRAFIDAIVSLPEETFVSTGTTVKASLLFLTRFTEDDHKRFIDIKSDAHKELSANQSLERKKLNSILSERPKQSDFYPDGVKTPTIAQRDVAKANLQARRAELKTIKGDAKSRLKELDNELEYGIRKLVKQRFDYEIFMYNATKVGINAIGEEDQNELYPNQNTPSWCDQTALEHYQEFKRDQNSLVAIA